MPRVSHCYFIVLPVRSATAKTNTRTLEENTGAASGGPGSLTSLWGAQTAARGDGFTSGHSLTDTHAHAHASQTSGF